MGRPMPGWDVADPRRGRAARSRAGRARRDLPARALEPALPARLLEQRRGHARRPSAASGSTPRTPRAQDEDGYFWYAGRADDVIISAGYRIGPFEVESACIEHPAVAEAAAVASPDERRGHVVKAFIVLADGYEPSDELADEIKALRARAASRAYAYPRRIEFVDDLPKTLTGQDPPDRAPTARTRPGSRFRQRLSRVQRSTGTSLTPSRSPRTRACSTTMIPPAVVAIPMLWTTVRLCARSARRSAGRSSRTRAS